LTTTAALFGILHYVIGEMRLFIFIENEVAWGTMGFLSGMGGILIGYVWRFILRGDDVHEPNTFLKYSILSVLLSIAASTTVGFISQILITDMETQSNISTIVNTATVLIVFKLTSGKNET
jgi:hypothetical protein